MKVLVVGDVIVDRYTRGTKLGVSAETPTIVGKFQKEDIFVGGAGLVVRNLLRLGAEVILTTPADQSLKELFEKSTDAPTDDEMRRFNAIKYPASTHFRITEKRRYYVDDYKLLQFDVLNEGGWDRDSEEDFCKFLDSLIENHPLSAVVVADNRHGTMTAKIAASVVKSCKKHGVMLYVDSQVSQNSSNHGWYEGADWFLLNMAEAGGLLRHATPDSFSRDYSKICNLLDGGIVVKMGAAGAMLYNRQGGSEFNSGYRVNAVDTCGAGDAFLAAFVIHGNLEEANKWAAISTTYVGTVVPKIEDWEKVAR